MFDKLTAGKLWTPGVERRVPGTIKVAVDAEQQSLCLERRPRIPT